MTNADSRPPHEPHPDGEGALGPLSRLRLWFARLWRAVREMADLLQPCRFSILVVVAGGLEESRFRA